MAPLETYGALTDGTPYFRELSEAKLTELMSSMKGVTLKIERNVGDYLEDLSYVAAQ